MRWASSLFFACAGLLLAGCATKNYVAQRVDEVESKVNKVDKSLQDTQKQLGETDTKLSATDETARAADARATTALFNADAASKKSDQLRSDLRGELNDRIANLDDYRSAGAVTVLFRFNSDKLGPQAQQELQQLVSGQLGTLKRYFIAIEGFTDKIGTAEYNLQLSRRRAEAVQTFLVSKANVPVYRLQIVGLGEDRPVNDQKTRAEMSKNRRVEVTLFSADGAKGTVASNN
jgi:outer membrane protein OmpA-like peptidoglycan-associated protein